jgi:peptidoglycan/LPS O-acetylase OafA/YrhL
MSPSSRIAEDSNRIAAAVRRHMPVLDGLRGLAIALVVAHNAGDAQPTPPTRLHKTLYLLHREGWVGVHLFFVLSGFLITGILLENKERASIGDYFRSFYLRRTLRIFPLYYATLIAAFVLLPLVSSLAPTLPSVQAWYWAYLSNWREPWGPSVSYFPHFWSLAVEEQFYLVWPLVVLLLSRRALASTCAAIAVVAMLVRFALVRHHAPMFAPYELTVARMDALVLGAAAALATRTPAIMARITPHLGRALAAFGLSIVVMAPFSDGFFRDAPPVQTVGHLLVALFFTALILVCVTGEVRGTRLARAIAHPALQWLGKYSYAIYVFHVIIEHAIRRFALPWLGDARFAVAAPAMVIYIAVVGGLSIAAALLSWHLLEKRFLALKDVIAPRPKSAPSAILDGSHPIGDARS